MSLDRPAHETETEIEVTQEMIEAGAKVLAEYYPDYSDWTIRDHAKEIYLVMKSFSTTPI